MSSRDWIIPLPPGFEHEGRRAVGFMPCHGGSCDEFMLVRMDKKGALYAPCDKAVTVRGCGRRYDLLAGDLPEQTLERVRALADDVRAMPREHQEYLAKAWGKTIEELTHDTEEADQEKRASLEIPGSVETGEPSGNQGIRAGDDDGDLAGAGDDGEGDPAPESAGSWTGDPELDHALGWAGR